MKTQSMVETILMVYDHDPALDSLVDETLLPMGFQVITAQDGPDGLDLAIRCNPDLILIEQSMALMTGLEVLTILRQTACTSSVVFLTETGDETTLVEAFRLGIQDCVLKPFTRDEVARVLIETLNKRRLDHEAAECRRNQEAAALIQAIVITLSHYLNNYLTSLKGGVALIEEGLAQDPERQDLYRIAGETRASVLSIQAVIHALARCERINLTEYSSSTAILSIETAIHEELERLCIRPSV